jgi:hypothetical protein
MEASDRPGGEDHLAPDVLALDAAATAAYLSEQRRREDAAAAAQLAAATRWLDLHPPADEQVHPLPGREGALRVAGQGSTPVSEFALSRIAPMLGMSERSVRRFVGQAVELRDRLPRIWGRVMDGDLPAWRARRIAERTMALSPEAAAEVDRTLASFAHRVSVGRIDAAVEAAARRFDPDVAEQAARDADDSRFVDFAHQLDGVTDLTARLGTPEAVVLQRAVLGLATTLHHVSRGALSFDHCCAQALVSLAGPQPDLDLQKPEQSEADPEAPVSAGTTPRTPSPVPPAFVPPPAAAPPVFHIHLHLDAVEGVQHLDSQGRRSGHVARVECAGEDLGPRSLVAVERWLSRLSPGATVTLTPVIDCTTEIAVDSYYIPQRLRDQVAARDPVCCFPHCGRAGAHDLDHIEAYRHPDEGGPPGQTSTPNLLRLCRYHHRLKTHDSTWTVWRTGPTTVVWRTPLGELWTVDASGTYRTPQLSVHPRD